MIEAKTIERFEMKIHPEPNSGCWLWTASTTAYGYGRFFTGRRNGHSHWDLAHRISYLMNVGPIPSDKELDHLCRVPTCVNPNHLEPVTRQVNVWRGWNARKQDGTAWHKDFCKRGHLYSGLNLYIWTDPKTGDKKRMCRRCHAIREVSYWRKRNGKEGASNST